MSEDPSSPKEFGKKYTPKSSSGGMLSTSSPFSKTTPIFAKRNPISNIQQTALASQSADPLAPAPTAQAPSPLRPATPSLSSPLSSPAPTFEKNDIPSMGMVDPLLKTQDPLLSSPAQPKAGMLSVEPPMPPMPPMPSFEPESSMAPVLKPAAPKISEPALDPYSYPQPLAPSAPTTAPETTPSFGRSYSHLQPHLKSIDPISQISPTSVAPEKKAETPKPSAQPQYPPQPQYLPPPQPPLNASFVPDEKCVLATPRDLENQVLIPAGTELEGTYKTDRSLVIQGRVGGTGKNLGNLYTNGLIYVSKSARVEANIQCSRLEIYGSVDGEIIAREEVLLHKGGKLQGKVQTPHFKTEPGSFFKGTMEMTGAEPSSAAPPPLR